LADYRARHLLLAEQVSELSKYALSILRPAKSAANQCLLRSKHLLIPPSTIGVVESGRQVF